MDTHKIPFGSQDWQVAAPAVLTDTATLILMESVAGQDSEQ